MYTLQHSSVTVQLTFTNFNYWKKQCLNFVTYHQTTVRLPHFEKHCFKYFSGLQLEDTLNIPAALESSV